MLQLQLKRRLAAISLLVALMSTSLADGQSLSNAELVARLRAGGQVILMRHASSPRPAQDASSAKADDATQERQLDEVGRSTSIAMGKALQELHVPINTVLSSPTYRALETIKLAQLPTPTTFIELDDGSDMRGVSAEQGAWLQQRVLAFPKSGNTVIVTHFPNIRAAYPQYSADIAAGEALVFGPDGKGGARLLARIKIEDWATLRQ